MQLRGDGMHRSVGQAIGSMTLAGVCLTIACDRRPNTPFRDLSDPDAQVRADSAVRLGQARAKDAVDPLLTLLSDPEQSVRISAIRALGEIGEPRAVPALIESASDSDERVRVALCRALGQLADPRAVPALGRLLRDGAANEAVRLAAARALAAIPGEASTEALVRAMVRDENDALRNDAHDLLDGVDGTRAVQIVEESLRGGPDPIRANAARVIGEMGERRLLPALIAALDDAFDRVRCEAAHALVDLAPDDAGVQAALTQRLALERVELVQVDLAWSLARMGDRSHVDRIRDLLRTGTQEVRAAAAAALGDVGEESDVPRLEEALDVEGMDVLRREAYVAIQKLKRG